MARIFLESHGQSAGPLVSTDPENRSLKKRVIVVTRFPEHRPHQTTPDFEGTFGRTIPKYLPSFMAIG